ATIDASSALRRRVSVEPVAPTGAATARAARRAAAGAWTQEIRIRATSIADRSGYIPHTRDRYGSEAGAGGPGGTPRRDASQTPNNTVTVAADRTHASAARQ